MILGTAGHVDHGKTALVRALTGVETDRLPDEKRRGITIDLGFAPLALDGLPPVSIVDVPGHEAFVRNMLAGATGIDLALLVIAADEGVMPQTREHLLILTLLGVSSGVVALSKSDLVDADWLALVRDDVGGLVRGTPFAAAPVVPVSAVTGEGLDELRRAIAGAVRARPARQAADLFRMPVDRVFTVRGTGTVVTGTVWSGSVGRDESVRLLPSDRRARVRGLQSHGVSLTRVEPGTRVAVALAGIDVADVERGAILVTSEAWRPSTRWIADVALDPAADITLGPRTTVRLHLGTAEVGARLVAPTGPIERGGRATVRVVLESAMAARAGDRFVLRTPSPVRTIGGGVILDPLPAHRRGRLHASGQPGAARLLDVAREAGRMGIALDDLPVRLGVPPADVARLVEGAGLEAAGPRLVDPVALSAAAEEAVRMVARYHEEHPLEPGMPVQEVRERLGGAPDVVEAAIARAAQRGALHVAQGLAQQAGWTARLSGDQERDAAAILASLRAAAREPPSIGELHSAGYSHVSSILRFLERDGAVVQVATDRYYDAEVLKGMVESLRAGMADNREYTPQEIRDIIGVSRKYLIPFLEYCDRVGVTERRLEGRVLAGAFRTGGRQVLA